MSPQTDAEIDQLLREAPAPGPGEAQACIATPEFDLGRLMAVRAGAEDAEGKVALDHLARCAFCRAMLVEVGEPAGDFLAARLNREWPKAAAPRRLYLGVGSGLLAAAAVLMMLVLQPASVGGPLPAEYGLEGPFGGVTEVRADVAGSNVFLPDSQVRIVLRPAASTAVAAPAAAVFRIGVDGRLARLPEGVVKVQPNGVILVEGEGRALFGATAGRQRLHVVLSADREGLSRLDGAAPKDVSRDVMRVYEVDVEYRLTP